MPSYEDLLLHAIRNPSAVTWNGPSRTVAALLGMEQPEVAGVAVGNSDGLERRVDAAVVADGREFSMPFFVTDAEEVVTRAWVYERPEPYESESGVVAVLNGPSGVGKSTLLTALHDETSEPWFVFDEPHVGRIPTEHMIWRSVVPALHRAGFVAMRSLAESGFPVATSTGGFEQSVIDDALAGVRVLKIGLRCADDEICRRLALDPHLRPIRATKNDRDGHEGWRYDLELRSDEMTPQQLATAMLDLVRSV
jgi:chloramphenicol 3-O-phosphotransferase